MANINEILARAAALRQETALNSIDPERAGGIMYDTLLALNELWLQQGAALVISKIYASVAAMNADTSPVSDLTGKPIRPGMVVVIASSDSDNGSVYRYNGTSSPRWSLVGKIGNITPEDSLTSDSTQIPLAARQGKVLDGKISQLGQEVDTKLQKLGFIVSKYSVQPSGDTGIWYGEQNTHIVIPIAAGSTISFIKNGNLTLYYSLLTEYIAPVENVEPSFVTGYKGRQIATGDFAIPAGTKYLIINNPVQSGQEITSLRINGVDVLNGIWQYALSAELANNKKSEIIRSNTNLNYLGARALYEKFLNLDAGLSACMMNNLFVVLRRNIVNTDGSVAETDVPTSMYDVTDYIPVVQGHSYRYRLAGSSSVLLIAEYDSSNGFIAGTAIAGQAGVLEGVYTPSPTAAYVRMCNNLTTNKSGGSFIDITERLYALESEILVRSITDGIVSNNIANPADVWDKSSVNNDGKIVTRDNLTGYKIEWIAVTPGQVITFGGNDCGRSTYYSFFSTKPTPSSSAGVGLVSYGEASQADMIAGVTVTVPDGAYFLAYNLQFNGTPSAENIVIQANLGSTLLDYDEYKVAVVKLNGLPIGSDLPVDNAGLIVDLPVSDGTDIHAGYAYINATTGVVTVKQS